METIFYSSRKFPFIFKQKHIELIKHLGPVYDVKVIIPSHTQLSPFARCQLRDIAYFKCIVIPTSI